jgi:hypothetical protein
MRRRYRRVEFTAEHSFGTDGRTEIHLKTGHRAFGADQGRARVGAARDVIFRTNGGAGATRRCWFRSPFAQRGPSYHNDGKFAQQGVA